MNKYCPYNLEIEQTNQYRWEYNEEGLTVFQEHKLIENQIPAKCKGRECGAWGWGRCRRK